MKYPDLRHRARKHLSRSLRPVQFAARRLLLRTADTLLLLRPPAPAERNVLLVRPDNIGDFVVWLDAGRALVEHFRQQGMQVVLLGSTTWASWAKDLGIFDDVLPLEQEPYKHDLRYRWRIGKQVQALRADIAILPTLTRTEETGDSLIRLSRARIRIGARGPQATVSDRWYTRLVQPERTLTGELEGNAAFVRAVTGTSYQARVADLRLHVRPQSLGALAPKIPGTPYFVLFPGASAPGRKWPAARFAELATRLHAHTGWHGILCGGPGDHGDATLIASAGGSCLTDLTGRTDLAQLVALLAGARLLVSNETSAIHFAAALHLPSVCITGGGHFGRFVPYELTNEQGATLPRVAFQPMACFGCNWTCKYHPAQGQPMPCVEDVSVDTVWTEVLTALHIAPAAARHTERAHNPTKDERNAALVVI